MINTKQLSIIFQTTQQILVIGLQLMVHIPLASRWSVWLWLSSGGQAQLGLTAWHMAHPGPLTPDRRLHHQAC